MIKNNRENMLVFVGNRFVITALSSLLLLAIVLFSISPHCCHGEIGSGGTAGQPAFSSPTTGSAKETRREREGRQGNSDGGEDDYDDEDREKSNNEMGNSVTRMMTYDRAANERNAISALKMGGTALRWHRLDDGVMGGMSDTQHHFRQDDEGNDGVLHFEGTINTNGGGFTSIRSPVPPDAFSASCTGVRIRYVGDGKTYKFLLSDGSRAGGPMATSPSWQADIPTAARDNDAGDDKNKGSWDEVIIPFDSLLPSFGGSTVTVSKEKYKFVASDMKQMGLMLSLKLSDGTPNPKETFGEGLFPFSLRVKSIDPVTADNKDAATSTCTSATSSKV